MGLPAPIIQDESKVSFAPIIDKSLGQSLDFGVSTALIYQTRFALLTRGHQPFVLSMADELKF